MLSSFLFVSAAPGYHACWTTIKMPMPQATLVAANCSTSTDDDSAAFDDNHHLFRGNEDTQAPLDWMQDFPCCCCCKEKEVVQTRQPNCLSCRILQYNAGSHWWSEHHVCLLWCNQVSSLGCCSFKKKKNNEPILSRPYAVYQWYSSDSQEICTSCIDHFVHKLLVLPYNVQPSKGVFLDACNDVLALAYSLQLISASLWWSTSLTRKSAVPSQCQQSPCQQQTKCNCFLVHNN